MGRQTEFDFVRLELPWIIAARHKLTEEIMSSARQIMDQKLQPNTILMHPATWEMIKGYCDKGAWDEAK